MKTLVPSGMASRLNSSMGLWRPDLPREKAGICLDQRAHVRFRRMILNPDGSYAKRTKWAKNLILDSGLDSVGAREWCDCFEYAAVGTGTNPFVRDSGAVTFTATGGVVTASSNFFEDPNDENRVLHLDSGEVGYITTVNSATEAVWTGPDVAVGSEGSVEYVNRTSLQTEVKRTNTYRTSGGDNSSTWSGASSTWTHQRTFLFSVEVGAVTYTEAGWSWGSGATPLFGGVVFSGGGDSLVAGQQYLIQVQLVITWAPTVATAAPDVGVGGWNTEGDIILGDVRQGGDGGGNYSCSGVNSSGGTNGTGPLEPGWTGTRVMRYGNASFSLPATTNGQVSTPAGSTDVNCTTQAYAPGTFTRTFTGLFSVSQANSQWFGVMLSRSASAGGGYSCVAAVLFDAAQGPKDNEHTVTVVWRYRWGRNNAA